MKKITDKTYTRNLHYHFSADKNYYERIDSSDKELLLFTMIEHFERLLMLYYEQSASITSLEQLVDDKHNVKLPCPPKVVPSVKLVFVQNERERGYDT